MKLNSNDLMHLSMALDDLTTTFNEHNVAVGDVWVGESQFVLDLEIDDDGSHYYIVEESK